MTLNDISGIASRLIHILMAVVLLGGAIFTRDVLRGALTSEQAQRAARLFQGGAVMILASGLYNIYRKGPVPAGYHMVFGIKVLLALHVLAVAFLMGKQGLDAAKRNRMAAGMAISGVVIVAMSAYLRWLSR